MNGFISWTPNALLFMTFYFAACVFGQMLAFILSRYRTGKKRLVYLESLLEFFLLLQILCMSLLHGQVYNSLSDGYITPTGYGTLRIAIFCGIAILAGLVAYEKRQPGALLLTLAAMVLPPVADRVAGRAYPVLFLLSLSFLFVRSVYISFSRYRQIKTGLSALSVKEAIDNLHTGILFGREDGRIILMNGCMQQLMHSLSSTLHRNGRLFYDELMAGNFDAVREGSPQEGQDVFILADGSAWSFKKINLNIRGKQYIQLTASNVSESFRLTAKLKEQDIALRQKSEELKQTIAGLHTLSHEREIQKAKMRAHDVLGRRLTLILRMMQGERPMDIEMLKTLPEGLLEALATEPERPSPMAEIETLAQIFGSIGVNIRLNGDLPEDNKRAYIFLEIIKESLNNAVRHGFASEINICIYEKSGQYFLNVENNGHLPPCPITEGGGIGNLRKRIEEGGGSIKAIYSPHFAIMATLPGGEA